MKKKNSILIFSFIYLINNSAFGVSCRRLRPYAKAKACTQVTAIYNYIEQLDKELERISSKTSSLRRIKKEIAEQETELKKIKQKHKALQLEKDLEELKKEQVLLSYDIWGQASQLYLQINDIIKSMLEDKVIRDKLDEIIKLKQEIRERVEKKVVKTQELGKEIKNETKGLQNALNAFKREKFLPLQQKLSKKLLQKEVYAELDKVRDKLVDLNSTFKKELEDVLTDQELRKIEKLNNAKDRIETMINFIQDPDQIQSTSADELLGLEESK